MRILVTGGCGFIGSNLVRYLLSQNELSVVNLDKLTYAANPDALADVADVAEYRLVKGDIADVQVVQRIFDEFQPDAVMHLAAESHVDRSIDGPAEFILSNIVGTFTLLDASLKYWRELDLARRAAFRFLHVSTDEVYGSLGDAGQFSEQTRYDPHSPYAASKASSDHLARAWHATYGLPVIVTNCSNNYGPWQFPDKLIPLVINRALRCKSIPVYGSGQNVRDWLYVEDHVRALDLVRQHGKAGETYNIGGNNECKNIELVQELCGILDELSPVSENLLNHGGRLSSYADLIEFVVDRPGHDYRYAVDSSKIRSELDWQPLENPVSGLRKTVQWYLQHRAWSQAIIEKSYGLERLGTRKT